MKVDERKCVRCPRPLGPNNHNKEGLCGYCQSELGPTDGGRYKAWVAGGKKQEIEARCERCKDSNVVKDGLCAECDEARERGKKAARTRLAAKNGHALDAVQALAQDPAMAELRELVRKYGITRLAMKESGEVVMTRAFTARGTL